MSTQPGALNDDPNGGSMPLGSESDAGTEPVVETPEGGQPAGGTEPGEATPESEPSTEQTAGGTEETADGRLIPAHIRALKETNPQAYAKAKGDFFDLRDRRKLHPTVNAAREEHELVRDLGGQEGVARMREDSQFFQSAARQFIEGSPDFVKDLWDEDPIAAALHVPTMLEHFQQKDRDGYNTTICREWVKELKAQNFSNVVEDLIGMIQTGKKEDAVTIAQSFKKWHDSILGIAQKAEDPRVKSLLAERQQRQRESVNSEKEAFLKSYRTDAFNDLTADAEKAFDSFFRGRKIDPSDRTDLLRDVLKLANLEVEKDADFKKQRDSHLQSNNAEAARRLLRSRFAKEIENSVKRVARRYGLISGQAAPKPSQGQPGAPKGAPGQRPAASVGFTAVNQRPEPEEINRDRTTNDMIISGRAVLRDGRKVSWAHLKERRAS